MDKQINIENDVVHMEFAVALLLLQQQILVDGSVRFLRGRHVDTLWSSLLRSTNIIERWVKVRVSN